MTCVGQETKRTNVIKQANTHSRSNTLSNKSNGPIKQPLNMRGSLPIRIGEHHCCTSWTAGSDGNEKLIYCHTGIHGDFAALEGGEGDFAEAVGCLVGEEFG